MFRSLFLFLLLGLISSHVSSQKLIPATRSEFTGIALPSGTQKDRRILSTSAALSLLEMKAKEDSATLGDQVEVFVMPPSADKSITKQIKDAAAAAGWEVNPFTTEVTYSLLKQKDRAVLMYVEAGKKESALYLAPVKALKPEKQNIAPAPAVLQENTVKEEVVAVVTVPVRPEVVSNAPGAFAFTTTNFDDGWNATIMADFVSLLKGNVEVQLIYPIQITDEARADNNLAEYYWRQLVAPQYSIKTAKTFKEPVTYFSTYFVEGEAINPRTNTSCYLALNVLVNSGVVTPVLAVSPDAGTYYKVFPEPKALGNMAGYNRFALGSKDLIGKWSSSSGSSVNLYNVYTGNHAGMNYTQSTDSFSFKDDGTYSSKHAGISSVYGNTQSYQQEYTGKVTVGQWEVSMTKRWKDATENFNAYFEAVKGGRILHLQRKDATGIWYHLVREP